MFSSIASAFTVATSSTDASIALETDPLALITLLSKANQAHSKISQAIAIKRQGLDFANLNGEKEYSQWGSYGSSKLSNILFTKELQKKVDEAGLDIEAVALHPGVVNTDLSRYMVGEERHFAAKRGELPKNPFVEKGLNLVLKDVPSGASTQVFLAAGQGGDVKGKYFDNMKVSKVNKVADDMDSAEKLWTVSEKLAGVRFDL